MEAVAAGCLAVAADPVPGDRQQQRGDAEGGQRRGVDEQAREEAAGGAVDRAAQERDRDERQQHDVGVAAEDVDLVEDRHLQDGRDEDQQRGLRRLEQIDGHRPRFFGTRTITERSESKWTLGES